MIRIALCDDEQVWLDRTATMLAQYRENNPQHPLHISRFRGGQELLADLLIHDPYDIYILDVVMPEVSGIETGIRLRDYDDLGKIIYLTTSPDFAVDSYVAGAFYYLLKPVDPDQLYGVLDRAVAEISRRRARHIKIKTNKETAVLPFDDILYVELKRKSLFYHTVDGETLETVSVREAFATCVAQLLEDDRFTLAGPGCCVNLFYIKSIEKDNVLFKNGTRLYLSKKVCLSLRSVWLDYWFKEDAPL